MSRDIIVATVFFFVIAAGAFMGSYLFSRTTTAISGTPPFNESFVGSDLQAGSQKAVQRVDLVVFLAMMGIFLGIVGAGYFLPANPIFISIYILCLIAACVVSPFLSSAWVTMTTTASFGSHVSVFPITNVIMNNLIIWVIAVGCVGMVVMFAKPGRGATYR